MQLITESSNMETARYTLTHKGERFYHDPPSFSSTLLDSIYRSLENSGDETDRRSRDRTVDHWMERTNDDLILRRRSLPPETTKEFANLRSSAISRDRRHSLGSMRLDWSSSSDSLKPIPTKLYEKPSKGDSVAKKAVSRAMKFFNSLLKKQRNTTRSGSSPVTGDQFHSFRWERESSSTSSSNFSTSCRYEFPVRVIVDEDKYCSNRKNQNLEFNDDDDDGMSCCSSDLFELEIGGDRHCKTLPVYHTTTNRAIC